MIRTTNDPISIQKYLTNSLRTLVSKKKRRFIKDGFDLDLVYLCETRIIAMGYPSSGNEVIYRNNAVDVREFLDLRHKDRYKIYNLCPQHERSYDPDFFYGRVEHFPFDDHNPPPMAMFLPFCEDAVKWLLDAVDNVVVVHCKAGKGRTGVMLCALLIYIGLFDNAEQCMDYYAEKRTNNKKGVTIPSQRRFVTYFAEICAGREHDETIAEKVRSLHQSLMLCNVHCEPHHLDRRGSSFKMPISSPPAPLLHSKSYHNGATKKTVQEVPSASVETDLSSTLATLKCTPPYHWIHPSKTDVMFDNTNQSNGPIVNAQITSNDVTNDVTLLDMTYLSSKSGDNDVDDLRQPTVEEEYEEPEGIDDDDCIDEGVGAPIGTPTPLPRPPSSRDGSPIQFRSSSMHQRARGISFDHRLMTSLVRLEEKTRRVSSGRRYSESLEQQSQWMASITLGEDDIERLSDVDGNGETHRKDSFDVSSSSPSPLSSVSPEKAPRRGSVTTFRPKFINAIWLHNVPKTSLLGVTFAGGFKVFSQSLRTNISSDMADCTAVVRMNCTGDVQIIDGFREIPVADEFLIKIYNKHSFLGGSMVQFWLHASFIHSKSVILPKLELDKCVKDKEHIKFPKDFAVEVFFRERSHDEVLCKI